MILILAQAFPPQMGGIERTMHGLAATFSAQGHEVRVHADMVPGAKGYDAGSGDGFFIRRFSGPLAVRRRVMAWAAAREIETLKPEAVLVTSWKGLEHMTVPPDAPLAVMAHGNDVLARPGSVKGGRVARALRKARVILANSEYTAALARGLAPDAPVKVVHPGVDPVPQPTDPARTALKAKVGDGPLLVSLARLEPRKGVDRTIQAFARLAATYPTLKYAVAGRGEDGPRLQRIAQEAGVADRVLFLGAISEPERAALLERTHIFVLPTRLEGASVEGYGLVYREAAQFGAPSIAGAVGGARDAVADGDTGLIVDGDSVEAVAAAIKRLLDDEPLRLRMGELARERVNADGFWRAAAQRHLDALKS